MHSAALPTDHLDHRTVAAAAAGEPDAIQRVLATVRPLVLRYCLTRWKATPRHTAEDLAQEVCVLVLRHLPRYRQSGPFLAWVYTVARPRLADAYRQGAKDRSRERPYEPEPGANDDREPVLVDPAEGPDLTCDRQDRARMVALAVAQLTPRQRDVVRLRAYEQQTTRTAAQLLGCTEGAVRICYHRAVVALRRTLAGSDVLD